MRAYSPMNLRGMLSAKDIAQELQKVQTYLRQLNGAITQIPGVSGNPVPPPSPPGIVPNPFDDFFYLPGRAGGQLAYGDTNASGRLTISSTRNATKGKVYFGSAQTSAYDEYNNRLGIKTASPSAALHVKGEAPSLSYYYPVSDNTVGAWQSSSGGSTNLWSFVDESTASGISDADYILNTDGSTVRLNLPPISTPTGLTVTAYIRMKVSAGTTAPFWNFCGNAVAVVTMAPVATTTSFVTYSYTFTPTDIANVAAQNGGLGWLTPSMEVRRNAAVVFTISAMWLEIAGGGTAGAGGKTIIAQAVASQAETLFEAQNSSGTALVDITAAGRLTVESGGSFRHVPGAAASTLFKGDASGDAVWGTVTLLSAYHSDTLAGTVVRGDIIYGNATPKWARLAIGGAGTVLSSNGTDVSWQTPASPTNNLLDGANHLDTVAQGASRGSLIYGNSTPKWDELVIGSANTVLRSDGTDASWGAIDHNYIADRTRSIYIMPAQMVASLGSPTLTTNGTFPNNFHHWQFPTAAAAGLNRGVITSFLVPSDWKSGTDMTIYAYTTKAGGGVDTARYAVNTAWISRDTNESMTTAVTTNGVTYVPSTTLNLLTITSVGTIANATLAVNEHVKLNIYRDTDQEITDNGAATNNTMGLIGIRIDYTAVM